MKKCLSGVFGCKCVQYPDGRIRAKRTKMVQPSSGGEAAAEAGWTSLHSFLNLSQIFFFWISKLFSFCLGFPTSKLAGAEPSVSKGEEKQIFPLSFGEKVIYPSQSLSLGGRKPVVSSLV